MKFSRGTIERQRKAIVNLRKKAATMHHSRNYYRRRCAELERTVAILKAL